MIRQRCGPPPYHCHTPHHLTTPSKEGVQDNTVSPEGRPFVFLDSRLHGNGMGGVTVRPATVPPPRKRESRTTLCRPQGDPLFSWIPVCTGMGWRALLCALPPYHSLERGSPGQYCVARRATPCLPGFPFALREWAELNIVSPELRMYPYFLFQGNSEQAYSRIIRTGSEVVSALRIPGQFQLREQA